MNFHGMTRRRIVLGGVTLAAGSIAGCLGDGGDDGDSEADETNSDSDGIDRPDDWPDNPAFTPNPDAEGPGGDVTFAMQFTLRENYMASDEFDAFEVDFEQVVLHEMGGDTVEVPVDRTIDFYEFEVGTDIVLIFDAAIPAGTYTDVEFHMDGSEIIHEDRGDVTADFERPEMAAFSGDGLETESGEQWLGLTTFWVFDDPELRAGSDVGHFTGPEDMSDPEWFAADE